MTNSTYVKSSDSEISLDELSFELINNADNNTKVNTQSSLQKTTQEQQIPKIFQTELEKTNKGPWSTKEDKLLNEWIKKNGAKDWHECSKFIGGRTGKQCREHWKNCLNPEVKKGEWTLEEDLLIMISYNKFKGSWRDMIHLFEGRTENSIKNRFFSQLRKIVLNDNNNIEKKRSSKFNLDYLLKYHEQGIKYAKLNYMRKNKMSQEEFKKYLNQLELKMKKTRNKKNNKIILENNLNNFKNSRTINLFGKKREKKINKKKQEENIINLNNNIDKDNININNINNKLMEIQNEETYIDNKNKNDKQEFNNEDKINKIENIDNKFEFKPFDSNKDIKINKDSIIPLFETDTTAQNNNGYIPFMDESDDEDLFMYKRTDSESLARIFSDKYSPNFEEGFPIIFGDKR